MSVVLQNRRRTVYGKTVCAAQQNCITQRSQNILYSGDCTCCKSKSEESSHFIRVYRWHRCVVMETASYVQYLYCPDNTKVTTVLLTCSSRDNVHFNCRRSNASLYVLGANFHASVYPIYPIQREAIICIINVISFSLIFYDRDKNRLPRKVIIHSYERTTLPVGLSAYNYT